MAEAKDGGKMQVEFEVLLDTIQHVSEVQENIEEFASDLKKRAIAHDRSKFADPEFSVFVSTRPEFKKANYGTPEYQAVVDAAIVGVNHHYSLNRHHTAHFPNGIKDMNLLDVLEMMADWRAASRRSPDLSFKDSLPRAFKKYEMDETLQRLILNTIDYLGWQEKQS